MNAAASAAVADLTIAVAASAAVTGRRAAVSVREAAATAQAVVIPSSLAASLPVLPALSAWARIGRIFHLSYFFVFSNI